MPGWSYAKLSNTKLRQNSVITKHFITFAVQLTNKTQQRKKNDMIIVITILAYFAFLMAFSRLTARRSDNDTFFRGNRRSPWYMVAFGMVGASISGITFVSVPGMVLKTDMTYLQTCLGFILGYFAVAFILLPVYYRLNLTTIYTYLGKRLGKWSYKTGASFFLLSKLTGSVVRFFMWCA